MNNILDRWQNRNISRYRRERRVLLLAGPRQCGKTTLVRQLESSKVEYRTLDDGTLKALAESDPMGFVRHAKEMMIIDEVQRVLPLLMAIKKVVDEKNRPGQFLLTGSANIQTMPDVQESLAGRISRIRLRTLTEGEIVGAEPGFLDSCFNLEFKDGDKTYSRDDIIKTALRGGFPETLNLGPLARARWHRDYIETLLSRDLMDIVRIHRHKKMLDLVKILSAWSSKFMNIARISTVLGITRPTLESYINALEGLYIIEQVEPWTKIDYARVGKQKKLFLTDSGLMSSILGFREKRVRLDPDQAGKLIETFAYNELVAQVDLNGGEYSLYHYRDREKREVDLIVERDDGALLGIEIKAAATISKNDFRHLGWFRKNIAGDQAFTGIVLYAGEHTGSFGDDLWAVPFGAIWRK